MPLLAYLAGQRDPDGYMIIVALDLNVGMEIDVCHFSACGVLSGQSLIIAYKLGATGKLPHTVH